MRLALALLLFAAPAWAGPPVTWHSEPAARAWTRAAVASWEACNVVRFRAAKRPRGADIRVRIIDNGCGFWVGTFDSSGLVTLDACWLASTWVGHEIGVVAHEVGHVLGLVHSADPEALMYPSGGFYRTGATSADCAALEALY